MAFNIRMKVIIKPSVHSFNKKEINAATIKIYIMKLLNCPKNNFSFEMELSCGKIFSPNLYCLLVISCLVNPFIEEFNNFKVSFTVF